MFNFVYVGIFRFYSVYKNFLFWSLFGLFFIDFIQFVVIELKLTRSTHLRLKSVQFVSEVLLTLYQTIDPFKFQKLHQRSSGILGKAYRCRLYNLRVTQNYEDRDLLSILNRFTINYTTFISNFSIFPVLNSLKGLIFLNRIFSSLLSSILAEF